MGQLGGERKGQAWWHHLWSGAGEPQSPTSEPQECWDVQLVGLALLPKEEFVAVACCHLSWCQAAISMANRLPESRFRSGHFLLG